MKSEDKARAAITTLREGFKALDFQRVCSELLILPVCGELLIFQRNQ